MDRAHSTGKQAYLKRERPLSPTPTHLSPPPPPPVSSLNATEGGTALEGVLRARMKHGPDIRGPGKFLEGPSCEMG